MGYVIVPLCDHDVCTMQDIIDGLSEESFQVHKTSLTVQRTEKPKKLKKQGSKYWYEISSKFYHFKRGMMLCLCTLQVWSPQQ